MARTPQNSETVEAVDTAAPTMSTEQLLTLVVGMQKQLADLMAQQAASSSAQTDAILELARPKEPLKTQKQLAEEANEKQFKDQQRRQEAIAKANNKWAQDNCEHLAGCNVMGETSNIAGLTSIIWHKGDVGQMTGICTVCQRIFKQSDEDFVKWRRKKSFNKESAAGQRTIIGNTEEIIDKSYLHDID